jgi:hypothetical protein
MRVLQLLLLFTLCVNVSHATNYYFSSVSGDDSRTDVQAQNPSTPWKSLDKLGTVMSTLKPGDSIFFKRGETFYGTLNVRSSGVSGNVIYYGAYGTGANPVISGLATLSAWSLQSAGIYWAPLDMPNLNIVTINGVAMGRGRWPNTGFLNYENNNGNTSITDNELPASPNWTGGEIVMRKYRFILDRHTITSQSGTTLFYSTSTLNGNNGEVLPVKGNGYFIQNHLATLDQFGEWFYDNTAKRLYVFFGANAPSSYVVQVSSKDLNASVEGVNYVTLENLAFEGGNTKGVNIAFATNILVQNCNSNNQGASAIYGDHISNVTVRGGNIDNSMSNGINFEHNADNNTVDGVTVKHSNMIAGMGRSGTGVSIGISVVGDNTTIANNRVIGAGYSGIQFLGNNVLVEKNYIDTFCTLKDDGGGVYTYLGSTTTNNFNRKIRNNIILNSIGALAGAEAYSYEPFGKGAGIYLDEHVNNVEITGNTIANGDWGGIFMHNIHDNVISGNLIYNHRFQILLSQYDSNGKNNTMNNNQYIARTTSQYTFAYRSFFQDNPSTLGTLNNNYYARPIDDNATIQMENFWTNGGGTSYISLAQWKSSFAQDAASQKSPLTYSSNIDANLLFTYNDGNTTKIVSLPASYVDVKNNQYAGNIALAPFTGLVLLKSPTNFKLNQVITFPAPPTKTYGDASFALSATSTSGLPVSYRVVSGPATISGNTVTVTGVGTVVLEASQLGDATYKPADVVNQNLVVLAPSAQTITFPAVPNKTFGNDAPFTLAATASSGLPVNYQVISGYATVSGNTVTLTGAGISTVIIEASQTGNSTYRAAAPVRQKFTVFKGNQTITFNKPPDKYMGNPPFALNATASSGLPVSYRVASGNATVSGNMLTITGTGSIWIEASQPGSDDWNVAPLVSQSFWVSQGSQTITFPAIPNKTVSDPPFTLAATASSGLPVQYQVTSGPATVSGSTVTLTGATGTVWIQASQPGDANWGAAGQLSRSFTVGSSTTTKKSQTITFPTIGGKTYSTAPFAVSATASSGLPVSFRIVSGPATVSANTVTLTGAGTVTIEASQTGNTTYNAAPVVQQSFVVAKANQTINFGPLANKTYGDPPFTVNATASSGLPVSFRIVSGSATISGNTVTLTSTGTVTIEASQAGDANNNAATPVQQSFSVQSTTTTKQNQTITFPAIADKTFGDAAFTLNATASSGLPVSYSVVSGPATVSGTTVTITGAGAVTIQASQAGSANFNAATPVNQSFAVNKANQTISFGALANKTYGDAPFAVNGSASSGLPVSFSIISGPATISGNTVTLTGTGTVTIQASQAGNGNYNAAIPVQQSFTVQSPSTTKQSQTITFGTLAYKTYTSPPFDLMATASSGLPVSYRVVSGPITISGSTVTITGVGSAIVEASQAGNTTYNAATPVQRSFTIGKAGQTISFTAPSNKVFGDPPFALTATASSGLPVQYRVVSGPATISGNMVTLTGTGTVTIEASQPGNTNYTAAYPLQRSFNVIAAATVAPTSVRIAVAENNLTATGKEKPQLMLYPNPLRKQGVVRVQVPQVTEGRLSIYDRNGRLVRELGNRHFERGHPQLINLDVQGLVNGTYILRLTTKDGAVSQAFQVL